MAAPEWSDKLRESGVSIDVWPWSDGHLGMENNSGYVNLTRGLVAKGYQDDAIKKVMGGNFLRLIEDTMVPKACVKWARVAISCPFFS